MKKLFKHSPKDAFLVAQTIFVLGLTLAIAAVNLSIIWILAITPFQVMLILNLQNTSLHHHTHWATFNSKLFNNLYELLISAATGTKPQVYRIVHSIHHKHVNDLPVNGVTKDGISVFAKGSNGKVENAWKFCFRRAVVAWADPWKYLLYQSWQAERPRLTMINYTLWRREQFAFVSFILLLLLLNFAYAIWFLFGIIFTAHFLNYSWHYGEHYGSYHYRGDTTQDSVGIYSTWYNVLCFRSGYHQEHHHRPGMHWTKLDEVTPLLPNTRVIVKGMHITNVPWVEHFKLLFKS